MTARRAPSRLSLFAAALAVSVVASAALVGCRDAAKPLTPEDIRQRLQAGGKSQQSGDHEEALKLALSVLAVEPENIKALRLAGVASAKLGRLEEALAHFERVPDQPGVEEATAAFEAAEIYRQLGQSARCEAALKRSISAHRDSLQARKRLAFLYQIEGRFFEARGLLVEVLRRGSCDYKELCDLAWQLLPEEPDPELAAMLRAHPEDGANWLGLAAVELSHMRLRNAEEPLRKALALDPSLIEAHAQLGHALDATGQEEALADWSLALPADAERHPMVWFVRARQALRRGDHRAALRSLWESWRRDPNHLATHSHLAPLLEEFDQPRAADWFRRRSLALVELRMSATIAMRQPRDTERKRRVASALLELGRGQEAWWWCSAALQDDVNAAWARETRDQLEPPDTDGAMAEESLALPDFVSLDEGAFPLPDFAELFRPARSVASGPRGGARVTFDDRAAAAGIDFRYHNGATEGLEGYRLFETTGGGVGVIDYDADGWPDLYFTQGGPWPPGAEVRLLDALYRNRGDGRAEPVAELAHLFEDRYSQGLSVGDIDNDGFPDLFIANLSGNRLFINKGDGTFSERATYIADGSDHWTTSCLIADLNGDGNPDLYEVNYVATEEARTKHCEQYGPSSCSPMILPADPDRLWLSQGDGRFVESLEATGFVDREGDGLGIIAADFDDSGRLGLFVGNDGRPNYLLLATTSRGAAAPQFVDRAWQGGLAINREGRPLASMGLALDDADGDGLLDLFVTSFWNDYSALYRQEAPGYFQDRSADMGLAEPSLAMTAWGSQFIDANLDGWPDLIVANGHIMEYSTADGKVFRLRPQFFLNSGQGHFQELPDDVVGPFFREQRHGRAVARLDWNRDGKEDAAITHNLDPAALLINTTVETGHYLALSLRGVAVDRDAIGTRVELHAGGRVMVKQLVAGDGMHCANERRLVFGLGPAERVDRLMVKWTDGLEQAFEDLPVDEELLLMQGARAPVAARPRPALASPPERASEAGAAP